MNEERIEARNISMYPSDWEQIAKYADITGVKSLSGALRIIIREWQNMTEKNNGKPTTGENPTPTM